MRTRNLVVLCISVLAFALIFWPGVYRYDRTQSGGDSFPIRIHRVTGRTEMFVGAQWVRSGDTQVDSSEALPAAELVNLTGIGGFSGESFAAQLYNGSKWRVTEIEYELSSSPSRSTKKQKESALDRIWATEWTRTFRRSVSIEPLASGRDYFSVGGYGVGNTADWRIVAARGVRPR